MKSAYPYSNIPPTRFLARNNVPSKTASQQLFDQRASQNITRKEQINNLARNTVQLDQLRDTGYHHNLLMGPNAFTSLGSKGTSAPKSVSERDAVLMQQSVDVKSSTLTGLQVGGGKPDGSMDLE